MIVKDLDLIARVDIYLEPSEKHLREAEELYGKGDIVQAGEKYWRSVISLLKAIAEARGKDHYSHRDLRVLVSELYRESRDKELLAGYRNAESLHANYYENFMTLEDFEITREAVLKLIEKLGTLILKPVKSL